MAGRELCLFRPVYKKDGESLGPQLLPCIPLFFIPFRAPNLRYFLMTNDCGQLQIDTEKKASSCATQSICGDPKLLKKTEGCKLYIDTHVGRVDDIAS